ncbi:MAG: hypothetical protein ACRDT6_07695 [Micromonosporaceae bacterium]
MHPQQQPGVLHINTKYHWIAFMLALFKPKATINGHPIRLVWGDNQVPLPPGVHHLKIWVQYLWQLGPAEITVDNRHGQTPPVFYGGTSVPFIAGAIDHRPVEPPGTAIAIAVNVAPLALGLLCCCGVLLMGMLGGGSGSGY